MEDEIEKYELECVLEEAVAVRHEKKKIYGDTYKHMSMESIKDSAKAKIEKYFWTGNHDDIVDALNYLEFLVRRME